MKINNINKNIFEILKNKGAKLVKKAKALGVATTIIAVSTLPNYSQAKSNNTSGESQNVSQYQVISEYSENGIEFSIKTDHLNNLYVKEKSGENSKELKIDKNGNATITEITCDDKKCKKTDKIAFRIKNFTGDRLDVNISGLKDKELASYLSEFTNYVDSSTFKDENNLVKLAQKNDINSTTVIAGLAALQGSAAAFSMYSDLIASNQAFLASNGGYVANQAIAPIIRNATEFLGSNYTGTIGNTLSFFGADNVAKTTVSIAEAKAVIETAKVAPVMMEQIAATETGALISTEALVTIGTISMMALPVVVIGYNIIDVSGASLFTNLAVEILSTCPTIQSAMPKIKENHDDNNPNNDYYQAFRYKDEVYINLGNPLSLDEASNTIKYLSYYNRNLFGAFNKENQKSDESVYGNNVYTLEAKDAIEVIENLDSKSNTIKATNSKGAEHMPENHAFYDYYNNMTIFNTQTNELNPNALFKLQNQNIYNKKGKVKKENAVVGTYFWHFHIENKQYRNQPNGAHSFFGMPVIVTVNDIKNFAGKDIKVSQLDNGKLTTSIDDFLKY